MHAQLRAHCCFRAVVVGGCLAWWQGVMAHCCCHAVVVVGTIGWGGHSLVLCWVCCHVHLVVGSLLFSCSSAGECLSVLIAVVGWLLHVVTSRTKMTNDESNSSFTIWLPRHHGRHGT